MPNAIAGRSGYAHDLLGAAGLVMIAADNAFDFSGPTTAIINEQDFASCIAPIGGSSFTTLWTSAEIADAHYEEPR